MDSIDNFLTNNCDEASQKMRTEDFDEARDFGMLVSADY